MFFFKHQTFSNTKGQVVQPEPAQQEAVGNMLGKLGIVWAGFFAGLKLSDIVLFATLIYTLLQIAILVRDKIYIPWKTRRAMKRNDISDFISGD